MTRVLIILGIVFLIIWWIRRPQIKTPTQPTAQQNHSDEDKALLRCAQCDVVFPEIEAFKNPEGDTFCSHRCLNQHEQSKQAR